MLGAFLKSGFKYVNAGLKSYCTVKFAEKTGMTIPELMLYKESVKDCSQYYSRKVSIFLKEYAQKSRAKRLQRKMPTIQTQPQLALQTVPSQPNKLMEIA